MTGTSRRCFSWQHRITEFAREGYASDLRLCERRICLSLALRPYTGTTIARYGYLPASHLLIRSPPHTGFPHSTTHTPEGAKGNFTWLALVVWSLTVLRGYGNINPLSIDYACRPRLRSRLTQGGLTWPWNPWSFGGRVSHPSFATHACILTRVASTTGSLRRFTRHTTLSYPTSGLDHEGLPVR